MYRKIYPNVFAGSLYANRLPIGIDSIIKNASYATIRKFYKDWYRPDLMAVIVVGDIDPAKAEEFIKNILAALLNPENERPRIQPRHATLRKKQAQVVTDKEATSYTTIVNYSAEPIHPIVTLEDYKKISQNKFLLHFLINVFANLPKKENPPFVYAFTDFGSFARGYESFGASIGTGRNDSTTGLKLLKKN